MTKRLKVLLTIFVVLVLVFAVGLVYFQKKLKSSADAFPSSSLSSLAHHVVSPFSALKNHHHLDEPVAPIVPVANVFTGANYTGATAVFGLGDYSKSFITAKGIAVNSIQSLKVAGGNILIAYDGDNFTGNHIVWDRNTLLTASSWKNKIISFQVQKNNNPVDYPVIVYTKGGLDGVGAALKVGGYNAATLTAWGIGPKTISSVAFVTNPNGKAVSGYTIKLFPSDNFKGSAITLNSIVYDLSKAPINFNDKTMSLQVCQGTVCQ